MMTNLPLTMKDLNAIDKATSWAFTRMMEYDRRGHDEINQDILTTLRKDYEAKAEETERVRAGVYSVLWADPEW